MKQHLAGPLLDGVFDLVFKPGNAVSTALSRSIRRDVSSTRVPTGDSTSRALMFDAKNAMCSRIPLKLGYLPSHLR